MPIYDTHEVINSVMIHTKWYQLCYLLRYFRSKAIKYMFLVVY
nr:MAG TPA: hypothetical protein [Caudoviricetes sp.]